MTAEDVRVALLSCLEPALREQGVLPADVSNDLDLRERGIVDSLGFMRLIVDLQRRLGARVDLSGLAHGELTKVGSLSRHIAESAQG